VPLHIKCVKVSIELQSRIRLISSMFFHIHVVLFCCAFVVFASLDVSSPNPWDITKLTILTSFSYIDPTNHIQSSRLHLHIPPSSLSGAQTKADGPLSSNGSTSNARQHGGHKSWEPERKKIKEDNMINIQI
jgi:hypothetical protein